MANYDENWALGKTILVRDCSWLNWSWAGIVLVLVINSCTPPCDNCETTLKGSEFFALELGLFVEYDVSEEEVALGWPAINRAYQWKERIAESYIDLAGDKVHRIARFRRTLDS